MQPRPSPEPRRRQVWIMAPMDHPLTIRQRRRLQSGPPTDATREDAALNALASELGLGLAVFREPSENPPARSASELRGVVRRLREEWLAFRASVEADADANATADATPRCVRRFERAPLARFECCVCFDERAARPFILPCKHQTLCDACLLKLKAPWRCPLCRAPI